MGSRLRAACVRPGAAPPAAPTSYRETIELARGTAEKGEELGGAFRSDDGSAREEAQETLFESVPLLSKMAMAISFRTHPLSRSAMAFAWRNLSI
jgi:hypothetical protein